MTPADLTSSWLLRGSVALPLLVLACHAGSAKFPWPASAESRPATHAEVRTLNAGYQRTKSEVLVREIEQPTRANLDYAAYHQNFMIATSPPEDAEAPPAEPNTTNPFAGSIEKASLSADFEALPLTESERSHPLAFAPLVEFLAAQKVAGADELRDLGAKVRDESWGLPRRPGVATQTLTEVFLHSVAGETNPDLYVKIEFEPWFTGLGALPDQDHDGYPEVYGRAQRGSLTAPASDFIRKEYQGRTLSASEVKGWANQLASYWYPSFNTDLVPPGATFPDANTEPAIRTQLGESSYAAPFIVMRGKPQGKPTYEVFLIKGLTPSAAQSGAAKGQGTPLELKKTTPSPDPAPLVRQIGEELQQHGGSWEKWLRQLAPFHGEVKKRLQALPKATKALAGADGFLFFRNSLEYVAGGDIAKQRKGKNPLPIIVEFKKALAARGVDFLFVPVPTKLEIVPEALVPEQSALKGQLVHPLARKFLLELAQAGVEVADLAPIFLTARAEDAKTREPLYQHQDTHWTDRGLRLAASALATRVKRYPWYAELATHAQKFSVKQTTFQRFGDLHSRLPAAKQAAYQPETLLAEQVLSANGALYEDDAESPVVVLGDSYAGVYELTDVEHAGVSAHLAKDIAYPVDLVMSYGGGPNVRNKLMRRGADALGRKKLVIWLMTARDLHDYWEDWEALSDKPASEPSPSKK
jgi:hypothetical protein